MTDKINLSFANDEHDLYLYIKNTPGMTREMKAYARSRMQGGDTPTEAENQGEQTDAEHREQVRGIYELTFGDIQEHYGTMRNFLRECGVSALKGRILNLRAHHPQEAADVLNLLRENHPEIGGTI